MIRTVFSWQHQTPHWTSFSPKNIWEENSSAIFGCSELETEEELEACFRWEKTDNLQGPTLRVDFYGCRTARLNDEGMMKVFHFLGRILGSKLEETNSSTAMKADFCTYFLTIVLFHNMCFFVLEIQTPAGFAWVRRHPPCFTLAALAPHELVFLWMLLALHETGFRPPRAAGFFPLELPA